MREEVLHYLFRTKSLGNEFVTTDNQQIKILSFGELNANAGPDFVNTSLQLDDLRWVGPIEFHLRSSDWLRHGHQDDPAYSNVVAHFVYEHDREIYSGRHLLPTVELKSKVDVRTLEEVGQLMNSKGFIPCAGQLKNADQSLVKKQIESSFTDRFERKKQEVLLAFRESETNHLDLLNRQLAGSFGGPVNKASFLQLYDLARPHLERAKGQEESLLFGISGLIPENGDGHCRELQRQFDQLNREGEIIRMTGREWKFSRMRPSGFPTFRIAQLAAYLKKPITLTFLINNPSIAQIEDRLEIQASVYWQTHYQFTRTTKKKSSRLSEGLKRHLIINGFLPFIMALSDDLGKKELEEHALHLFRSLPAEKNRMTKLWVEQGVVAKNALESQGLIDLKRYFCDQSACLSCRIGKSLIYGQ